MATKIPKIRFSRFDAAWEQRKLIDEVELFGGLTYSPKDVVPSPGSIVLRSSNVKGGEISLDDNVYVLKEKATSTPVQLNDIIVVVRNGSRSLIGKHAIVKAPLNNAVIGAFMTGFRTKQPDFINVLMDTHAFKKAITENLGATINQITGGMLKQMVFFMPASEKEKRAIGNLFRTLDDALALHQKKLKHFKNLKESLLQNMFPREGEIFPRLRFPEFTDAWEQCELGSLAEVTKLAGFEFTKYVNYSDNGTIIALRGLNIKEGLLDLKDVKYIDGSDLSKLARSKLFVDDIVFTYVGTVGEVALIPQNDRFYLAPNVARIRINKPLSSAFLACQLGSPFFYQRIIFPLIATSSQPALSMQNIRKFNLGLPQLEEQEKIASLFAQIGNVITLHQRKLAQLKKLKTCLFNNLFVN